MIIDWNKICAPYSVKITWNTFFYDTSKPIQYYIDNLLFDDDLLQIEIHAETNMIFDVGWPDFLNPQSHFVVYLIQDYDWDNPLETLRTRDVFQIIKMLQNILQKYGKPQQHE